MFSFFQKNSKGYIALVSVLVLGALAMMVALSLNFTSITASGNIKNQKNTVRSLYLTSACAEEALRKIKADSGYQGNENLSLWGGICRVLPLEAGGGGAVILKTEGEYANALRRLKIVLTDISPQIILDTWEEVADF